MQLWVGLLGASDQVMYGGFVARIFHRCIMKLGKIPGYYLPMLIFVDALR